MAYIYIDPTASTNGAGTQADPKNTWVGLTWAAGNAYLQKAGTTFTTAVGSGGRIAPSASGTASSRILIGAYGEGSRPRIYNRADTGFNLDRRAYITLQDFEINNTEATAAGVGGGGDTASQSIDVLVQGCYIHSGNVEGMSFITNLDRQLTRGLVVRNNHIENVGGHGILCAGEHINSLVTRNRIGRCGFTTPKHGISAFPHRASPTPTWTLVSGNVYKVAIGAQTFKTTVTDIYGVLYWNAARTLARAASPTAPGSFEYGFSGGELYINIGGVPSGQITYSYTSLEVEYSENIVSDVVDFDGNEGHGIQLDDLAANSRVFRNIIYNCEGRGIQLNMGRGNKVSGNLIYNCALGGMRLDVNGATLNEAYNNTLIANASATGTGIALGAGSTAKNNAVIGFTSGITGTAASTEDYNLIIAATVRSGGIAAGANDITSDPLLTDAYRPRSGSPLIGAGTHLGYMRDLDGKQRPNPPSIGAYDVARVKTA